MLIINSSVRIPLSEIELSAIRAQGAGGQNVNKVASAIHLRFDIRASSLSDKVKNRLLAIHDRRISDDGVIVIKAQRFRSQDSNREDALHRLQSLIAQTLIVRKKRRPSRPSLSSRKKRMDGKARKGSVKALRGKVRDE